MMQGADAVLVLNLDRHGIPNYIGGNTLMEIGFAHVLNQKIFLYNPIPEIPYYKSEIEAVKPVIINGDLTLIRDGVEGGRKRYNKLVRDKIPDRIRAKGERAVTHIADEAEYWLKLKEKLAEEVKEFNEAENIEEIADLFEVIDAIIEYKRFDADEVERVKRLKADERGRFTKRIILEES